MSRTTIFITNNSSSDITIKKGSGHVDVEQGVDTVPAGSGPVAAASIGDPGNMEHVTTGQLWLDDGHGAACFGIRRKKDENCKIDETDSETGNWGYGSSNDYTQHDSQFFRSLTITISST